MNQMDQMKALVKQLNDASKAYYQENKEVISNFEYDKLYDELLKLEKETGTVLSGSPTVKVGYELLTALEKEAHESPMLSLDKTKDVGELGEWLNGQVGLLSWKLDGLTVVLTYENGELIKAVTRGNGQVGEVITANARVFDNLPAKIPYKGKLVLRGEAIIPYSYFKKMNEEMDDLDSRYKNPRNLCSGSVRQLNNQVTAGRHVHFYGFSVMDVPDMDFHNSLEEKLNWAASLGFDMVDFVKVTQDAIGQAVAEFEKEIPSNDQPSDGLVLAYDDMAYGKSLGTTAKFPRDSIAFKWADETAKTELLSVEWSPSRTGLINPVAVFRPVELEGTTVSRASLHNLSVMEELELGIGDTITVYKANMIIPQVAENETRSNELQIPDHCPACGGETVIEDDNGIKTLVCPNGFCSAKQLKLFAHFVSRDAMNIDGLSEATLERMLELGYLDQLYDLFDLERHEEALVSMKGFGEKSYHNLIHAVSQAKHVDMPNFLYSLGIAGVGLANAKLICRYFHFDFPAILNADPEELAKIDGIGPVIGNDVAGYFRLEHNRHVVEKLLKVIQFNKEEETTENDWVSGKTFVITGSLHSFENRRQLSDIIEKAGGKTAGSVSAKTDFLINNDNESASAKNKKAKELGVPIITEDELKQHL